MRVPDQHMADRAGLTGLHVDESKVLQHLDAARPCVRLSLSGPAHP